MCFNSDASTGASLPNIKESQKLFTFKQFSYKYFQQSDKMVHQSCDVVHPYLTNYIC